MSRRFADMFDCYRKTETTQTTGEVTTTEVATVTNGRCNIVQRADSFSWRDDRGRLNGQWLLIAECSLDIAEGDKVVSGGRNFEVLRAMDVDLRFQEVRLNAL